MNETNKSKPGLKLIEGKTYPFNITGRVILADGLEYFLLEDPMDVKHLLECEPYKEYDFSESSTLKCRVDKINCTGKIFLEPLHPHYELDQVYDFRLLGYTHKNNSDNNPEQIAVFEDVLKKHVFVSSSEIDSDLKIGGLQKFRINKIKRGKVFLINPSDREDYSLFVAGKFYLFKVREFVNRVGIDPHFIFEDESGHLFKIREKFYKAYNIQVGGQCRCMFVDDGDQQFFEPEHPYFKMGKEYDFKIVNQEEIRVYPNMKKPAYFLGNKFGKPIVVLVEDVNPDSINNNHIRCTVIDIKKSKPSIRIG